MKTCIKCKINKEISQFYKSKSNKDGLDNSCKTCKGEMQSKKHILNKEKINSYHKQYYIHNKQKHILRGIKWKEGNKEKYQNYLNKYSTLYYHKNIQYKLRKLLRSRLYYEIGKINSGSITNKMKTFLGCSLIDLKYFLENQFKPEMSWANHGLIWEIDHIIGCCNFDLSKPEEQAICFHYTNMRPLFKTTKIAKSFGYNNEIGNRDKSKINERF